ncbi:hypothetical protein J6590_040810 [Homalodisca vitripennis]|nr:hypothetical protein J6590_040810 [Homalodisca vitripennis]
MYIEREPTGLKVFDSVTIWDLVRLGRSWDHGRRNVHLETAETPMTGQTAFTNGEVLVQRLKRPFNYNRALSAHFKNMQSAL